MKRFNSLQKKLKSFNQSIRLLLLSSIFYLISNTGYAQTGNFNDNFGVEEALQSISKYTNAGYDRVTPALEQTGYQIPEQLKKDWTKMPAARRIGLAYKAAANVSPQNGEKFLAMLSQNIAQQYGAVYDEPALQKHLNSIPSGEKVAFKHIGGESVSVTPSIKKSIMTIGKYTEAGALGGMQNIMKNYFDLPDDVAYDILEKSNSHNDALQRASKAASIPPPPSERFGKIANDIHHSYGAAHDDPKIQKLREKGGFTKSTNSPKSVSERHIKKLQTPDGRMPSKPSIGGAPTQLTKPIRSNSNTQYQKFVKANYKGSAPKFGKAIKIRGGFGGVIFGNDISTAPNLSKPSTIRWMPYKTDNDVPTGQIEFILKDGTEKVYGPVLTEDFIAAIEIVNSTEFPYKEGDAIGLVGIENKLFYPDSSVRWEVVLHPAVSNLRIGWVFPVVDAMPIATDEILTRLEESDCCKESAFTFLIWKLVDMPETWKITESEMQIRSNKNRIEVINPNSIQNPNIVLSMTGFKGDKEPQTDPTFEKLVPSLVQIIPEYNRANEFAKTLALVRWAKKSGSKIPNISSIKFDDYVDRPHNVIVTNKSTISFWSFEEDRDAIVNAIQESVMRANDSALIAYKPVINIHKKLIADLKLIQSNRFDIWGILATTNFDTVQLKNKFLKEKQYNFYSLYNLRNGYFTKKDNYVEEGLIECDNLMAEQDSLILELITMSAELSEIRADADSLIRIYSPDSLSKHQLYVQKIESLRLSGENKEDVELAQNKLNLLLRNCIPIYRKKHSDLSLGILMYQFSESRFTSLEEKFPGYMGWKNQMKTTWRYLKKEEEFLKYYTTYYSLFNSN